ncbi:MAG: precorrin-8X methylmutase [Deltaproteobacteria bacterium]|nr:precorrin-8X methylmutase [Deltaproteobacteria bacterium]
MSFQIIEREIGAHNLRNEQWIIVRRMIHTSADFGYKDMIRFHPDAIKSGLDAIRSGKNIITDTNMARVGIRKREIEQFGGRVRCYMNDQQVHSNAKATGVTRAKVAVDMAVEDMQGGIYVIGNAPTALLRLIELVKAQKAQPALIIGLPVGFVNAAESKAALMELDYPFITNEGRKGGSNVAASVVNALTILAKDV